jgi:hypothetical protein
MPMTVLVDVANVMGSRPDGWWRDRAAAASRLLDLMPGLVGRSVSAPDADGEVLVEQVVAVVEGAARHVAAPDGVIVVRAPRDGDSSIVSTAERYVDAATTRILVITADRGLRARLPDGVMIAGPGWFNRLVGR